LVGIQVLPFSAIGADTWLSTSVRPNTFRTSSSNVTRCSLLEMCISHWAAHRIRRYEGIGSTVGISSSIFIHPKHRTTPSTITWVSHEDMSQISLGKKMIRRIKNMRIILGRKESRRRRNSRGLLSAIRKRRSLSWPHGRV
jgi:hypothetical protein